MLSALCFASCCLHSSGTCQEVGRFVARGLGKQGRQRDGQGERGKAGSEAGAEAGAG